ncbi:MAG: Maf family protein [Paracoccaceae bacterium]
MNDPLILASGSEIRAALLQNAGLTVERLPARIDEDAIKAALQAEGAPPRDIADALAEAKARKVAVRRPDAMVLGCDQVLEFNGALLSKPGSQDEARRQIAMMRGKTHRLLSAAVLYHAGEPVWRHVGTVRLTMRDVTDPYLHDYVFRNWPGIGQSVGGYKLEEEGVRLFARIEGDYFTVLGLPLIELLNYLGQRGFIAS